MKNAFDQNVSRSQPRTRKQTFALLKSRKETETPANNNKKNSSPSVVTDTQITSASRQSSSAPRSANTPKSMNTSVPKTKKTPAPAPEPMDRQQDSAETPEPYSQPAQSPLESQTKNTDTNSNCVDNKTELSAAASLPENTDTNDQSQHDSAVHTEEEDSLSETLSPDSPDSTEKQPSSHEQKKSSSDEISPATLPPDVCPLPNDISESAQIPDADSPATVPDISDSDTFAGTMQTNDDETLESEKHSDSDNTTPDTAQQFSVDDTPPPRSKKSVKDSHDAIFRLREEIKATLQDYSPRKKTDSDQRGVSGFTDSDPLPESTASATNYLHHGKDHDFSSLKKQLEDVLHEINPDSDRNVHHTSAPLPHTPSSRAAVSDNSKKTGNDTIAVDFTQLKHRLHAAMRTEESAPDATPQSITEFTKQIIESFRHKLNAVTSERDTLLKTVEHLRGELKQTKTHLSEKTVDCESAQTIARERIQLAQQVMEAIDIVNKERDQALFTIGELKRNDAMQSKLLIDAEAALQYKNTQVEDLKQRVLQAQTEIETRDKEIEQLHIHLAQQTAQRDQLHERISMLEQELQTSHDSRKALAEIRRMMDDAHLL